MKLNRTYLLHSRVHVPHRHSLLNTPFSDAPTLKNNDLLNLALAAGPAGEAVGSECVYGRGVGGGGGVSVGQGWGGGERAGSLRRTAHFAMATNLSSMANRMQNEKEESEQMTAKGSSSVLLYVHKDHKGC